MNTDDQKSRVGNIVRIDFANPAWAPRKVLPNLEGQIAQVSELSRKFKTDRWTDKLKRVNLRSAWVVRLVAVLLVLILSMLVL